MNVSCSHVHCTIHLLCLQPDITPKTLLKRLPTNSVGSQAYILKGRVHGWVHRPHRHNVDQLLAHEWDMFILSSYPIASGLTPDVVSAHISVQVAIPLQQFAELERQHWGVPKPLAETPPLPEAWPRDGGIPDLAVVDGTDTALRPGELRLDREMADFLSSALPDSVANAPISLLNLFRYRAGDRTIHDAYMDGFKKSFGNTAGAGVKFMGPVQSAVQVGAVDPSRKRKEPKWNDANLVQYDSIWHYAYMLSTGVYAKLNKQKMKGLSDTCILCVSETELA